MPDHQQKWETIGPSKKEAAAALSKHLASINTGKFVEFKPSSFSAFAEHWLAGMRQQLRPRTWASYKSLLDVHIQPSFGTFPLHTITRPMLKEFVSGKTQTEKLAPNTVRNILRLLHKLFEDIALNSPATAWVAYRDLRGCLPRNGASQGSPLG